MLVASLHGSIDLVVLDAEGSDLDALKGFDIGQHRPRMLIIEDNAHDGDPVLRNTMMELPCELVCRVAVNDAYVRQDEAEILERGKWMKLA